MTDAANRARRLKGMLCSDRTTVLTEAHNGLSAKLAAEAGFEALWGSGLAISAAMGVRDTNEASWTQVLEVLEFMADATDLPILLDGDTGYGNFNNVRRLVSKLEQRGIAGVCLGSVAKNNVRREETVSRILLGGDTEQSLDELRLAYCVTAV